MNYSAESGVLRYEVEFGNERFAYTPTLERAEIGSIKITLRSAIVFELFARSVKGK